MPNATVLIWKVLMLAERRFRRLEAPELLADVYDGRTFADGKAVVKSIWKQEKRSDAQLSRRSDAGDVSPSS